MLKRTEIRLAVLGLALLGTASAWYLISPLFTSTMIQAVFPTLGFMPSRTPRPATSTPLPSDTPLPTLDLGQNLLVDVTSVQLVLQGEFYALDHAGRGVVSIYSLDDSSLILRFEGFQVEEGSDLRVVLTSQKHIESSVGVQLEAMVDLGPLKAAAGDQNYAIPVGLDPYRVNSVVIWSAGTSEPFIAASLESPH